MHDRLSTSNGQGCANGKPIDLVLQRLRLHDCDLSLNGEGYKCRCPAHDDNSPSLSVKEGDDGTVLVHCFAGCNATAVVHSIDLELKDLFPPKPESAPKPKKARKVYLAAEDAVNSTWHTMKFGANKVKAIDASWWTYVVNSKPVMVMARFNLPDGDKEFRPFHPVPSGWSIGDPAGKLPLYRRDALDSATVVWVFEGEGCCDRVVALDLSDSRLIPTTSAHGAQSPHKTDWSPLAGKTVILCPDNDQAGEKYKDDVAGILSGLDPKPVIKVVRLPLADKGDDVKEWIQDICPEGWEPAQCAGELERLATEAPEWEPVVEAPPEISDDRTFRLQPDDLARQLADDLTTKLADLHRTDLGNAERLVERFGDRIRYCHPWSRWLVWDGKRWALDRTAAINRLAKMAVQLIAAELKFIHGDERKKHLAFMLASESRKAINAMMALAACEDDVPILSDDMNKDPWLFNCQNGTIDLRTGMLRGHRKEDLITQLCPIDFDPNAECPLWDSTLELFFAADRALIEYWRKICGYCLIGVIRDHIMPVAYGKGENGKSTILGTLMDVFGCDYAMKCPPDMLMAKKTDTHPTDRADLFGKRLVVAIETEAGRRLNETMVKELTGGDRIRARRMHENFWEFSPTHTLLMATNHKPGIRGNDHGIWRRLKLIPFAVTVKGKRAIKDMPEKLRAEYPGILAWCVRGCLKWQTDGLEDPSKVQEATEEYREEQDRIGAFLAEHMVEGPNYRVKARELYTRYKTWCEQSGEFFLSEVMFSAEMEEREFKKVTSNGKWYLGIALEQIAAHIQDWDSD